MRRKRPDSLGSTTPARFAEGANKKLDLAHGRGVRGVLVVCLGLAMAVWVAYADVLDKDTEFLQFDDVEYVVNNPQVHAGLSADSLVWALTTTEIVDWHPLTWWSLQLDHELYGLNAAGFHGTNVLLHSASSVIFFLLLNWTTRRFWPSAIVAALFALHPLRVESVAWIAERKDVLSTLFGLLSVAAYVWYTKQPSVQRYVTVLIAFGVCMLAKQTLVTLPLLLLLLDYWPLARWRKPGQLVNADTAVPRTRLLAEKLPLVALAIAAAAMTMQAHRVFGDSPREVEPIYVRLLNACLATAQYLGNTVWPLNLSPRYTRPSHSLPIFVACIAGSGLVIVTVIVSALSKRRPYAVVGWLWFLIALAPVLGVVEVGIHTRADRYTYVPHLGLLVLVVWGAIDLWPKRWPQSVLFGGACVVLVVTIVLTRMQAQLWRQNLSLWEHAVRLDEGNYAAHDGLGMVLLAHGRVDESIRHFQDVVRIEPKYPLGHYHLGTALQLQQKWSLAAASFAETIRVAPAMTAAYHELGFCMVQQGDMEGALAPLAVATERQPRRFEFHHNLGVALLYRGQTNEAARRFREALRLDPKHSESHKLLGTALAIQGEAVEAERHLRAARQSADPDAATEYLLAWCLHLQGRPEAAHDQFRLARQGFPKWPREARNEAWRLATDPDSHRRNGALALLRAQVASLALENRDADSLDTMAAAYAELGRFEDAAKTARQAASLARNANQADLATRIEARLLLYERGEPFRQ